MLLVRKELEKKFKKMIEETRNRLSEAQNVEVKNLISTQVDLLQGQLSVSRDTQTLNHTELKEILDG